MPSFDANKAARVRAPSAAVLIRPNSKIQPIPLTIPFPSMTTTYDPQRNQIIRNIDCLIASAGNRKPLFWLLVRDGAPTRAYIQLINNYKADPSLLVRDLPHRNAKTLRSIAQNLTILLWSDFMEWVCALGFDPETAAVQRELERRILG